VTRVAVLALAACTGRASIETCDDDLRGVYAADGERWMVIDRGATLEAYPLMPDVALPDILRAEPGVAATVGEVPRVEVTPRVIALTRTPDTATHAPDDPGGSTIEGAVQRCYLRGEARCDARAAVSVTRCSRDTLELVVIDPAAPLDFAPCVWPTRSPARVARWRRVE